MKDLKHLYYFEQLLEDANNELVRKGKEDGKLVFGYTCFNMPEVLLNLGNSFSVRLRAPKTGSMDIATYYMSNYTCEFCRAILERSIEGGYNFLDSLCGVDACAMMNRCMENIEIQNLIDKENFFVSNVDVPLKTDEDAVDHYMEQLNRKVLAKFRDNFGIDTSDASIRESVKEHNEICRIITEIGEIRKEDNPRITGYEFHIICLITYCCPKYLVKDKLLETLEELKLREADETKKFKAKAVVVGSEIDDPELIKLIEESGILVVADRFCFGSFPGRQEIMLNDEEDAFRQVCRTYLDQTLCPRFISHEKIDQRRDFIKELYADYNADGVIYEQIKFCDFWGYERALGSHILQEEEKIPTLSIDRPYMSRTSGQLRTRFQAFVESIEIKKIRKDKEDKK